MPGLGDVFTNSGNEAEDVNGFVQDRVGACAEGLSLYSCRSCHHHYRRMLAVLKRTNEFSQLHAARARNYVTHQYDIVVLASPQRFVRAKSVTIRRDLPVVVSEDRGEKACYAPGAFSNEY